MKLHTKTYLLILFLLFIPVSPHAQTLPCAPTLMDCLTAAIDGFKKSYQGCFIRSATESCIPLVVYSPKSRQTISIALTPRDGKLYKGFYDFCNCTVNYVYDNSDIQFHMTLFLFREQSQQFPHVQKLVQAGSNACRSKLPRLE